MSMVSASQGHICPPTLPEQLSDVSLKAAIPQAAAGVSVLCDQTAVASAMPSGSLGKMETRSR